MSLLQLTALPNAVALELVRLVTGKLFSDEEIKEITKGAIGRHFAELFPEPADERAARERVEEARSHITAANEILTRMQSELHEQSTRFDQLLSEIEEKRLIAERYSALASTNKQQFEAYKQEISDTIRAEIEAQANKGRRFRQATSLVFWVVTLAIGAYFKEIVEKFYP